MRRLLFAVLAICCVGGFYGSLYAQESLYAPSIDSVLTPSHGDSVASTPPSKPHIVKRDFDGRQQVVVGTAIMTFLVVIITTVSNWNP